MRDVTKQVVLDAEFHGTGTNPWGKEVAGFHAETKLTFHRTIRVGDKITARVFFDGFDGPIESNFGGIT